MVTVTPERLKEVVVEVLTGFGAAEDEAPLVADSLVRAEMQDSGSDSDAIAGSGRHALDREESAVRLAEHHTRTAPGPADRARVQ